MAILFDALFAYNDWANRKIFALCDGLSDAQLDQPKAMGFGTLRATLFHILAADTIWLERWCSAPWRPFPIDPAGQSLEDMWAGLQRASAERSRLIAAERDQHWQRIVEYRDSKQILYRHRLSDLLWHVFNHGVHHRAQALNYLRQFERSAGPGIDFIFYRLAEGSVEQPAETLAALRSRGLAANEHIGEPIAWDGQLIVRAYEYGAWATNKLLGVASGLDSDALDRSFDIGFGSLRKILLHMFDVERWQFANWCSGPTPFPHSAADTPLDTLQLQWQELSAQREAWLNQLDASAAAGLVSLSLGGHNLVQLPLIDLVCQIATHGTHHRAQVVNVLRQLDRPSGNIDVLYALAELSSPVPAPSAG